MAASSNEFCTGGSEADMMKACSPLYATMAIESFSCMLTGLTFVYLFVRVNFRTTLKSPIKALLRLTKDVVISVLSLFVEEARMWTIAHRLSMKDRFIWCRKANACMLIFQGGMAFLGMTRWLHVGNVNGMRYLAYAVTCPIMQAELVLMIAPIVPCYRLVFSFTVIITFAMLVAGWIASILPYKLFDCDLESLMHLDKECFSDTGSVSMESVSLKFKLIFGSVSVQTFLTFVHIPFLAILYVCNGGRYNKLLPPAYLTLLLIVCLTWLSFPAWWFLSYEGMGIIQDTKMNNAGFALLNVVSKAAFTFQVLTMVGLSSDGPLDGQGSIEVVHRTSDRGSQSRRTSMMSVESVASVHQASQAIEGFAASLRTVLRNYDDGGCTTPYPEHLNESKEVNVEHRGSHSRSNGSTLHNTPRNTIESTQSIHSQGNESDDHLSEMRRPHRKGDRPPGNVEVIVKVPAPSPDCMKMARPDADLDDKRRHYRI